jgi:predicted phage gp36 major capsid-like protein
MSSAEPVGGLERGEILMWNNITPADFEEAREELQLRREETLRKHAEEISALDAEQADVESLDRMVTEFAEKFKIAATSSSETSDDEEQAMPGNTDEASTDEMEPAPLYLSAAESWQSRVA